MNLHWGRTRIRVALAVLICTASIQAQVGRAEEPQNPLASLPSSPGPHLEKIKALGDNEWVALGQAEGCSRFPRKSIARGRAWASKMAFAPDLGGAFFCGTGSHGAQPEGYYMDDLWFYDANAHQWICLYPGATKQTKLHLDKNGLEVDEKGNHIPVSYLSHAYNNITYDTDQKKYFIFWTQCPWWGRAVPQRWAWLDQSIKSVKNKTYGNPGPIIATGKHPLFWDVKTGQWERRFVAGDGPGGRFEGITEYIPSRKQTFRLHHGVVYFYDYAKNEWIKTAGKAMTGGYDANGCYDAENNKIYVAGRGFHEYDVKAHTWRRITTPGGPASFGTTNSALLYYDSVNKVVVWHHSGAPVFVYDPAKDRWNDMGNTLVGGLKGGCWSGFYYPELNAHLVYVAGDSGNTGASWVAYRYKRADAGSSKAAEESAKKPVGEIVNGLQLSLKPLKAKYTSGETWRFDTRVYNKTDATVVMDIFDGDTRFEIEGPGGKLWPPAFDRKTATRNAPIPSGIIKPRDNPKSSRSMVDLPPNTAGWVYGRGHVAVTPGKTWNRRYLPWPKLPPGKYTVRWVHDNSSPDDAAKFRRKNKEWIGTVKSNDVEITVVE